MSAHLRHPARALALAALLLPVLASAGWRQVGALTGTPQDVVVVDAGLVVATSTTGASAWAAEVDGGVTTIASMTGTLVGAALFDGGCLVALDTTGNVTFSAPTCGTATATGASTGRRLRLAGDRLVLQTTTTTADTLRTGPLSGPWPSVGSSWLAPATHAMQTARVGGADFHVSNASTATCQVSIDGGATTAITLPAALRDVSAFDRQGFPAALGVTGPGAVLLVPDLRATMSLSPSLPAGAIARFVGMAPGAGMLTTTAGEALSPVPDPSRDSLSWRARRSVPALLTNQVHCLDARWCAAIDSTLRVFLYENAAPPQVNVAAVRVDAGATVRLAADAGDDDGDPLFLTWSSPSGGALSPVAGVEDGFAVDLVVPPGAACGVFPLEVSARDGLHTTVFPVDVQVVGQGTLTLVPAASQPFAGGGPVVVSAFIDGGCESASLSWSSSDGQSSSGASLSWSPPPTSCSAGGETVTLTATAAWGQGSPTTRSTQVVVEPWGAPETPVFPAATQPAGTTRVWAAVDSVHACAASAGFPGTELVWEPIDAGSLQVQRIDGGLSLTAPSLCVDSRFVATARRQVIGEQHGRLSDAGSLVVDVIADVAPLDAMTPFGVTASADAGLISGALSVGASCLAQRELSAEVSVLDGTTPISSMTFAVPGGWALSSGSCEGGQREVVARLLEDGGFTGAEARAVVTLAPTPVAVGTQAVEQVEVRCGEGAKARVELLQAAGTCGAVATTWRAVEGPQLEVSAGVGTSFDLATTALDFSTVGQRVALEWAVDGGGTNVASSVRTIALTVAPFVEVAVSTAPAQRREERTTWFEITLRNTTSCAVEGLSVDLPLSGASPLLESVMLDDAHVVGSLEGTTLRLEGVSLPGDGLRVMRFGARARLLGSPSVEPVASLNGLIVSNVRGAETPGPAQCGCSGAPGLLGLLALVLVARRRRR